MLVLDTDHVSEYQRGLSSESHRLAVRLDQAPESFCTTIITVEEIMRGWMASIAGSRSNDDRIHAYSRLRRLFRFFATWPVLEFDRAAAQHLDALRQARVRIGTMDLLIASICLAHNATLLTRNRSDFERVPGLKIEDWLAA